MNEEDDDTSSVLFYDFFVDCIEEEKEVQIHETISIFFILYYDRQKSSATYAFLPTEEQIGEIIQSVYISFFTPFVIHFLDFSYPSFVDIDEIFTDLQSILCLQAKHDYVQNFSSFKEPID